MMLAEVDPKNVARQIKERGSVVEELSTVCYIALALIKIACALKVTLSMHKSIMHWLV